MTTETLRSPAYFVSPVGRDSWSGTLSAPNAEGTDGPFATLTRARDAMRGSGVATTYVRGGTYTLGSALTLTAADSNRAFIGYPGETAVISGGQRITGFTDEGGGVFSAAVGGGPVGLDLSIGGVRQSAAQSGVRDPADVTSGFFKADEAVGGASRRAFTFREGDIRPGDVQAGTKVQVFDRERLTDDIVTVESVDFVTRTVQLASDTWYPLRDGSTFRLLNNASFLRNAGEFGWRASDGRLVVKPQDAAGFEQAGVVAARTGTLVDITGASGVTLQGLTFADTTWTGTAVRLTNVTGARIGDNRFLNVGSALSLAGSSNNLIGGNAFESLGAGGLSLTAGSNGNRVYANRFEHIGTVAKHVAAISGSGIHDTVISHNDIAWSARDGIAIKNWSADTKNTGNIVEYNRIAHTGLETADAAAISVLGRSDIDTRMIIRGNRIEDANGLATGADHTWLRDYKGFGIYLDDQTNGATVTDNFIDDADWAAVFVHGGDDNSIRNNIAVMRRNQQELVRIEWTPLAGDAGTPRNNSVIGNIAYGAQPVDDYWELLSANSPTVDNNLVFNSAKRGSGDLIADPRFLDPAHGDWRLAADSPAAGLGIQDLPWARMGVAGYTAGTLSPAFWIAASTPVTPPQPPAPPPPPPPSTPSAPPPSTSSGGSGGGGGGGGGGGTVPSRDASLAAPAGSAEAAFATLAASHGIADPQVAAGLGTFLAAAPGRSMTVRAAAPVAGAVLSGDADTALLLDGRALGGGAVQVDGMGYVSLVGTMHMTGGAGANAIAGDAGTQTIWAGEGNDTVTSGGGNDDVNGNVGADDINGNLGNDTLLGGRDDDTVLGGRDNDDINGNLGSDVVNGNLGNDTVHGGQGNDAVYGGQGDDKLWGDLGDDWLSGDLGNDVLTGGAGADVFAFRAGAGWDVITDFRPWEGDRIQLQGLSFGVGATAGGEALIVLSDGSVVQLAGVEPGEVSGGWFVYA